MLRTIDRAILTTGILFALLSIVIAGCSTDESRVSARSGQIILGNQYDSFNFSVELPSSWTAGESFSSESDLPAWGWIVDSLVPEKKAVHINWTSSNEWDTGLLRVAREGGHAIEERLIAGTMLQLVYPDSPVPTEGQLRTVGAVYDDLPGRPEGAPSIALTLWSLNFRDQDIQAIIEVYESIRYTDVIPPPEPPVVSAVPSSDWVRLGSTEFEGFRTGMSPGFSVMVPPGTTGSVFPNYDTVGFSLDADGVRIAGERGRPDIIVGLPDPGPGITLWRSDTESASVYFSQEDLGDGCFELRAFFSDLPGDDESVPRRSANGAVFVAPDVPADRRAEIMVIFNSVERAI